jgi:hypothetical protein
MPPKTRATGGSSGEGSGSVLPTTAEELAQLINQHVTAAIGQHIENQNAGLGRGHGIAGGSSSGGPTGNYYHEYCS